MTKEELEKKTCFLYNQAFKANNYMQIIKQYHDSTVKHLEAMNMSPTFYQIIFSSLLESTFIMVTKLYDKNSYCVDNLIDDCESNISLFPLGKEINYINNQIKIIYNKNELSNENENFIFFQKFDCKSKFEFFKYKINNLEDVLINLKKQRNKIYVHNDKINFKDVDEFINNNPVKYKDIEKLISFALEVTRYIISIMTDINKPTEYLDIDDWENTLRMVEVSEKYIGLELKK